MISVKPYKTADDDDDDDDSDPFKLKKGVYIFGRDVSKIKCFRDTFICGICCGIGGGLAAFLFTSKAALSSHVAFASLWIGAFGYWFPCRYNYEKSLLISAKLKAKGFQTIERSQPESNA